ncbi:MAG: PAS domain-containing sensor histidine kinase, partial [Cyanobacteria bacterium]|nr:PAS domain-containing sensor histidine kinase [Cyanobacteriota bacterium]
EGLVPEKILGVETELFARTRDGDKVPIEMALGLIELEDANNLYTGIIRDVRERKESENRLKEFYSTVSHELRTPLTAIRTALGLLENSSGDNKFQSIVDIATEEADRLIRMVNDILDIRRIEAGKLNLVLETTNIKLVIDKSVRAVQSLADQAEVSLVTSIDEDIDLRVDLDRIHQVLTNLLSNAIKFSPRNSSVRVTTISTDDRIMIEVDDEGPGIPPEESEKIFGRFEQLVSREERSRGGTGLGLAIAKGIVENHGGTIGVKSRSAGSVFWFELPLD